MFVRLLASRAALVRLGAFVGVTTSVCLFVFSVPARGAADDVTTIAGTGAAGFSDGPASSASFLMPTGLAHAADGTLYIADEAAQRIRMLRNGVVTTIAGSGALAADGLSVKGGYRDGPALEAQFSRPTSLAIGRDGALYIADSVNACIRKLQHEIVSTVAGKCGERGTVDGARDEARLKDPRALAFDRQGDLYIADFDWGLRKLDPHGTMSTVHFKSIGDRRIWSVAIGGDADNPTLIASTPAWLIVANLATGTDNTENVSTGAEGHRPFGSPFQLAALDQREYLFTDLRTATVRYLRIAAPPFATTAFTRTLAGGRYERSVDDLGYADGTYSQSRFFAPYGIVAAGGVAYVSDAGARRIRRVVLPHTRVSESGFADTTPYDASHYHIAYIGASWAYWDSLDGDSICAGIETRLDAARRFPKPVRCHPMRIDAASYPQIEDYLNNYLNPNVNLLVINMTLAEVYAIFPNSVAPSDEAAAQAFKSRVAALAAKLAPHTKILLFWTWDAEDVSDSENLFERVENPNRRSFPVDIADNYEVKAKMMIEAVRPLPIFELDSHPAFLSYERAIAQEPLYGTDDSHLNPRGSAFAADLIARYVETEQGI